MWFIKGIIGFKKEKFGFSDFFCEMLTSCVNKQTNKHAESESEVFSKSESADFREVRGLGLGRPKSSEFLYSYVVMTKLTLRWRLDQMNWVYGKIIHKSKEP
jgi:hypothetical protein